MSEQKPKKKRFDFFISDSNHKRLPLFKGLFKLIKSVIGVIISPIFIVYVVFYLVTTEVLIDVNKDTYSIANSIFVILLSFSAIVFNYSRAITDDIIMRDCLVDVAEKFLHSGLYVLFVIIIKFGYQYEMNTPFFIDNPQYHFWLRLLAGIYTLILLIAALNLTQKGLSILHKILIARYKFNEKKDREEREKKAETK